MCKDGINPKMYTDKRGWMYRVMSGIGENAFKARYIKPDITGWKCVKTLPWRETFAEAQRDLDELAELKGWEESK